jgi:putative ABC transport system permease protein
MRLISRVPLAWLNLTHSKARFLLSMLGISFAVVLMLVQLGFWRALLDSQTAILNLADADLFLVSASTSTVTDAQPIPLDRIHQARAVAGVDWAQPLYVRYVPFMWKNRDDGEAPEWPIRVVAFEADAQHPAFRAAAFPDFAGKREELQAPRTALLDDRSKSLYDLVRIWRGGGPSPVGAEREVAGKSLRIAGLFRLGTDFTTDGNLLMTARNLADFVPDPDTLESVDLGLIKLAPGASSIEVQAALRHALPADVRVVPREDLIAEEENFWTESTPTGFVFMLGLAVGFTVGVVICYQILATEVNDHLAEFATLKAIGYGDGYINRVVLNEALLLSMLGFVAGMALGWPLYAALEDQTGLPLKITLTRAGLILMLTVGMCVLSGFLALRRVRTADPAEVFG